jgi:hypothetical protein
MGWRYNIVGRNHSRADDSRWNKVLDTVLYQTGGAGSAGNRGDCLAWNETNMRERPEMSSALKSPSFPRIGRCDVICTTQYVPEL